jgi:hypothetical protein
MEDFWSLWNRIAIAEGEIKLDLMKVKFRAFWSVHIMGRLLVKGRGSGRGERHGRLFLRRLSTG